MRTANLRLLKTSAVLFAAVGNLMAAPLKEATVSKVVNDVKVISSSQAARAAQANEVIRGEQAVATGAQSRAELVFSDKTLARLGANTVFNFKDGTRNMDLKKGTMLLQVPKGAGGAKITTAAVTAAITGTTIMIETNPGGPVNPLPTAAPVAMVDASTVLSLAGTVQVAKPGSSEFMDLQAGQILEPGCTLRTGADSQAVISPLPGTSVQLTPGTTLTLTEVEGGAKPEVTLDLKQGGVYAGISARPSAFSKVARRTGETVDFKVRTPQGVAAAKGTLFLVMSNNNGSKVVGLQSTVQFTLPNGQSQNVTSGFNLDVLGGNFNLQALNPSQLQGTINGALNMLKIGIGNGLLSPDLASKFQQVLQQQGIPLTNEQQGQFQQIQNLVPPPNPLGDPKPGHTKVVVLEGTLRLFLNNQFGESVLIGPGKMIFLDPNANVIPEPVDVDLKKLVLTSKLINGFEGQEFEFTIVNSEIQNQEEEKKKNNLIDTPLLIVGDGTELIFAGDDLMNQIQNLINASGFLKHGPLVTHPGNYTIDSQSTIVMDPTISHPVHGAVEGRLYSDDFDGSATAYFFGGTPSPMDSLPADKFNFNAQVAARGDWAAFKFESLNVSGIPAISSGGFAAAENLALISVFGTNLGSTTFNVPGTVLLASESGSINVGGAAIDGTLQELVLFSRNGNVDISGGTFDVPLMVVGAAGTVDASGTQFNGMGVDLFSLSGINTTGATAFNVGQIHLSSLAPINFSGGVNANTLINLSGFGINGDVNVNGSYDFNGGTAFSEGDLTFNGDASGLNLAQGDAVTATGNLSADHVTANDAAITVGGDLSARHVFANSNIDVTGGVGVHPDHVNQPHSIDSASGNVTIGTGIFFGGINDGGPALNGQSLVIHAVSASLGTVAASFNGGSSSAGPGGTGGVLGVHTQNFLNIAAGVNADGGEGGMDGGGTNHAGGDGGEIYFSTSGGGSGIGISGAVSASGASGPGGGGDGGRIEIHADGGGATVNINATVIANGGSGFNPMAEGYTGPGGNGGFIQVGGNGGVSVFQDTRASGGQGTRGGDGGNIEMTSQTGDVVVNFAAVEATGGQGTVAGGGNGGHVALGASGQVVIVGGGAVAANGGGTGFAGDLGNGGGVVLSGANGVVIDGSYARANAGSGEVGNSDGGNGGNVSVSSASGNIQVTNFSFIDANGSSATGSGSGGNGGTIFATAFGPITVDNSFLYASGGHYGVGGNGGNVTVMANEVNGQIALVNGTGAGVNGGQSDRVHAGHGGNIGVFANGADSIVTVNSAGTFSADGGFAGYNEVLNNNGGNGGAVSFRSNGALAVNTTINANGGDVSYNTSGNGGNGGFISLASRNNLGDTPATGFAPLTVTGGIYYANGGSAGGPDGVVPTGNGGNGGALNIENVFDFGLIALSNAEFGANGGNAGSSSGGGQGGFGGNIFVAGNGANASVILDASEFFANGGSARNVAGAQAGNIEVQANGADGSIELNNSVFMQVRGGDSQQGPGGNGGNITLSATGTGNSYIAVGTGSYLDLNGGNGADNTPNPANGGNAGSLTVTAGSQVLMEGTINGMGGNAAGPNGEGGDGAVVSLTATQGTGTVAVNEDIIASTGQNNNVIYGGKGGSVKMNAGQAVTVGAGTMIRTGDDGFFDTAAQSRTGGDISLTSTGTGHSSVTTVIDVQNSSQLLALVNSLSTDAAGKINVRAASGRIQIAGILKANANASATDNAVIDVRNTGLDGVIDIANTAELRTHTLKVATLGAGGQIYINGGTFDATQTLKLYGGTGGSGGVYFTGNTNLSGSAAKYIVGHTVQVNNGVLVNVSGPAAQVFTAIPNYTGSGGNGSTTGQFTGAGATTAPLGAQPSLD
jgi:ferric-dicitrate binding protein FerR (iron transport regulator)